MSEATTAPREVPILFRDEMVCAILAGRKSQTRRLVKPAAGKQSEWLTDDLIAAVPHGEMINGGWQMHHPHAGTRHAGVNVAHDSPLGFIRPRWRVGDTLWVRETWFSRDVNAGPVVWYRADGPGNDGSYNEMVTRWKPSIHMPRCKARLFLRVTAVRVERVNAITEEDAIAEGMPNDYGHLKPVFGYEALWDSMHGAGSFASGAWVWVVSFERIENHG